MRNLLASREGHIFFFKDRDSRFLLVSDGFFANRERGLTLDGVVGKTDADFFSGPHAEAAHQDEQRLIATGEPMIAKIELETFVDRPDAWVSTTKLPLRDDDGNIVGVWGISSDVTAEVVATQALAASRDETERGLAVSVHLIGGLGELSEQTERVSTLLDELAQREVSDINTVSGVIDGVARQTRLLALNAAIEAARAGEHGRGFAVVADEVGRLAAQTAAQTAQIAETIEHMRARMEAVQEAANAARERAAASAADAGEGRSALQHLRALLEATSDRAPQSAQTG
jgi:PAS domain S-box-containing protein